MVLPDGRRVRLFPFHVCLKGLENNILFRDEEDYDVFVKMIFVCSRRLGITVIIYGVVSNHSHECVLAASYEKAKEFGERLKIMYSRYFNHKYGEVGVLRRVQSTTLSIDSDYYLRNVLAYIPRNALDNGARNVSEYKWTGYRAMFCQGKTNDASRYVHTLTTREMEQIMHTGDNLNDVPWILNSRNEIEPASCCNWRYLEKAFNNDQAFFLRLIGGVNPSEMNEKLVDAPRMMKNDNEFLKTATDICQKWYSRNPCDLPIDKKARIIPYMYRTARTTVSQLARVFALDRDKVDEILRFVK